MKAAAQPWKPPAVRWPPWRRPRRPARRSASLGYPGPGSQPPDAGFRRARPPGPPYPPGGSRPAVGSRPADSPSPSGGSHPAGGPRPVGGSRLSGPVVLSGPRRLSSLPDLSAFPNSATGPAGPTDRPDPPRRAWRRARNDHPSGLLEKARWIPRPGRVAALRREMEEGVPEVVDVLRATVAAGINPRRALQAAAEGAPPALVAVLDQAIRAAELGAGAGRALATAAKAERLSELTLAGEALDLAETTGAPPGPVLAGVATAAPIAFGLDGPCWPPPPRPGSRPASWPRWRRHSSASSRSPRRPRPRSWSAIRSAGRPWWRRPPSSRSVSGGPLTSSEVRPNDQATPTANARVQPSRAGATSLPAPSSAGRLGRRWRPGRRRRARRRRPCDGGSSAGRGRCARSGRTTSCRPGRPATCGRPAAGGKEPGGTRRPRPARRRPTGRPQPAQGRAPGGRASSRRPP